ncbi:cytokine-like nuclear factor N-PAC isoform X3 [Phlebotomus argentipes]|uniref:cytokine-like nuclear factor N-PAC isoform X3 n=1 Tax=Phlebotomus argentipes TaxID=94469 RepID=UPI002893612B|nr:cytokine-like nuclear factor N-PAC isoform X3 [Phlebotomus argentipes]
MTDSGTFALNDLVWAKMRGFSPWPGRVVEPPPELKKIAKKNIPAQCIFFFGSNNYAWIENSFIRPYEAFKSKFITSYKTVAFKEAVEAIEKYIKDPEVRTFEASLRQTVPDPDEQFDKLREEEEVESPKPVVTPKKTPKRKEKPKASRNSIKKADNDVESPQPERKRKRISTSLENNDVSHNELDGSFTSHGTTGRRNVAASGLLNRPAPIPRPETPEIDMSKVSQTLKSKNITPSSLRFGFLGLGIMGCGIVKNLINSGHKVVVWNRTFTKCRTFAEAGAQVGDTPSDVVDATDITFSCVADPQAAKDMVFGNCGVLQASSVSEGKGYVEMTGIDSETSTDIADAIVSKGGRYLEAQIQGSKAQAEEGTLIILAAGERLLFEECQTCFEAIGKNSFFLGDVGNASRMNLVLQMIAGISLAGLSESMALAERAGLQTKDVLEVLELTNMASPLILEKGHAMTKGEYPTHHPLTHMQKDLHLALQMSETLEQSLPITASANEVFKHAKRLGYSDHDASAVYVRARF